VNLNKIHQPNGTKSNLQLITRPTPKTFHHQLVYKNTSSQYSSETLKLTKIYAI